MTARLLPSPTVIRALALLAMATVAGGGCSAEPATDEEDGDGSELGVAAQSATATTDTFLKTYTTFSGELPDSDKCRIRRGTVLPLTRVLRSRGHVNGFLPATFKHPCFTQFGASRRVYAFRGDFTAWTSSPAQQPESPPKPEANPVPAAPPPTNAFTLIDDKDNYANECHYLKGTERPPADIRQIVLHNTLAPWSSVKNKYQHTPCIPAEQGAAHYIVLRDGKVIRTAPDDVVAYHAGNFAVNKTSLGIEIEAGNLVPDGMTKIQESGVVWLVRKLQTEYRIDDASRITMHRIVALASTDCAESIWAQKGKAGDPVEVREQDFLSWRARQKF